MDINEIKAEFSRHFYGSPRLFSAPGRVNLIGEHTDYNDGFVFPMALEYNAVVAITSRQDRNVTIRSEDMSDPVTFSLDKNSEKRDHWSDYVAGVACVLEEDGMKLPGADMLISSSVPVGAGLSSSAAIEISSALAFLSTVNKEISSKDLALLGQRAENTFVMMNCGIMDQFISVCGEKGHALFLDCRSLEYSQVPLPSDKVKIVICNTMVKHELGASAYNERRAECEQGVEVLKKDLSSIKTLRDVTSSDLEKMSEDMPEMILKRCHHVISENERVLASIKALSENDLVRFGQLMNASHDSLRDDYEVSCPELDRMVDIARGLKGCLGARMTGGGFGGCTVNLVEKSAADAFTKDIFDRYEESTGIQPEVYVSVPSQGAHEITSDR
ncbi:MAG: galactokinase [Candidatus Tantalella remota]|nr:galactokinase [Candidatus Tantalella remota]